MKMFGIKAEETTGVEIYIYNMIKSRKSSSV